MVNYVGMDNYKIIKKIGEGSFGAVYQAKRTADYNDVALKQISKFGRSEADMGSLCHEFELQRDLQHPNIVRMLDAFETAENIIIITEFAAQGDLSRLLAERGRCSERVVVKISADLVAALHYLLVRRILHRDLKPQNVLIGSDGNYKLCDFGFAKALDMGSYLLTSVKGTPLYMAPEIIHLGIYDEKADLWSLGCILYECLTGKPPFMTTILNQLVQMIKNQSIVFPPNIFHGACLAFVKGLLEKNPQRRLCWPNICHHPFIATQLSKLALESDEKQSLAKVLSTSEEMAKEKQNLRLLAKVDKLNMKMRKAQKKLIKTQKELGKCEISPSEKKKVEEETNANEGNESDSSCETLTSTSDDDEDDEDEDVRTVVDGAGSGSWANPNEEGTDLFWKSGTDFSLHGLGNAGDKPIQSEEWIHFLTKTIREVKSNPGCICEKHFLAVLVAPLRNHLASGEVYKKIGDVLSVPFTLGRIPGEMEKPLPEGFDANIKAMYMDSKVIPNLLYATKVLIRNRKIEHFKEKEASLEEIIGVLSRYDTDALESCLRLISFLVYLDQAFAVQICDSLCVLQLFPIFLLFLKMDVKNVRFTCNTIAILCQLLRISSTNAYYVEEMFLGACPFTDTKEELWRLLTNVNLEIKAKALRLVTYFIINSSKAREYFVGTKIAAFKLWSCVKEAKENTSLTVHHAALFAFRNIEEINIEVPVPHKEPPTR